MKGLLTGDGRVSELMQRAASGKTITVRQGEKRTFLSCYNAAHALLYMIENGFEGRFTLKGENEVDMAALASAVKALAGSHSEIEVTEEAGEREHSRLVPTEINCLYRREQAYVSVPACIMGEPSRSPDAAVCAEILKG